MAEKTPIKKTRRPSLRSLIKSTEYEWLPGVGMYLATVTLKSGYVLVATGGNHIAADAAAMRQLKVLEDYRHSFT